MTDAARRWIREAAARVLLALEVGAAVYAALTVVLAAVYAAHHVLGVPPDLEALPWLVGPAWATVTGLGLRLAVSWIVWDAARAGRRRLRRCAARAAPGDGHGLRGGRAPGDG